jgi:hypothetical protein
MSGLDVGNKLGQKTYSDWANRLDRGGSAWHDYLIAPNGGANESKGNAMTTMTTAEVAADLQTTPRALRKFLRSDSCTIEAVGKGSRYAITKGQIRSLRSQYAKFLTAQEALKAEKADNAPEGDEGDNED